MVSILKNDNESPKDMAAIAAENERWIQQFQAEVSGNAEPPNPPLPDKNLTKAREAIKFRSDRYYRSLWAWFIGTSVATFLFWSISLWATSQFGWQARAVEWASDGAAVLCLFTLLMLGALIYGWHKSVNGAMSNVSLWDEDPQLFRKVYRDAIGPIPWTK